MPQSRVVLESRVINGNLNWSISKNWNSMDFCCRYLRDEAVCTKNIVNSGERVVWGGSCTLCRVEKAPNIVQMVRFDDRGQWHWQKVGGI